jgi:hypothetical protein
VADPNASERKRPASDQRSAALQPSVESDPTPIPSLYRVGRAAVGSRSGQIRSHGTRQRQRFQLWLQLQLPRCRSLQGSCVARGQLRCQASLHQQPPQFPQVISHPRNPFNCPIPLRMLSMLYLLHVPSTLQIRIGLISTPETISKAQVWEGGCTRQKKQARREKKRRRNAYAFRGGGCVQERRQHKSQEEAAAKKQRTSSKLWREGVIYMANGGAYVQSGKSSRLGLVSTKRITERSESERESVHHATATTTNRPLPLPTAHSRFTLNDPPQKRSLKSFSRSAYHSQRLSGFSGLPEPPHGTQTKPQNTEHRHTRASPALPCFAEGRNGRTK